MPNRKIPPLIQQVSELKLPEVRQHRLDNGIPLYEVRMGTQEAIKLELAFHAGRPFERQLLAARATASQLREGSAHYSSGEIAEQLDFYGCSLSIPFSLDTSNVILYSLSKHFSKALPLLADMLGTPAFPEQELEAFVRRNQQRLAVDLTKNDVLAYRHITELIFGTQHPYGYNSYPETYGALKREVLLEHFHRLYNSSNCTIFLSGRANDCLLAMINEQFSRCIPSGPAATADIKFTASEPRKVKIERPDSVQAAVRIGRHLFNRHHRDYMGVYVLNNILGGYFGSRLMANIREEKGYTYNIYSTLDTMRYDGLLAIGTEVGNEFVEDTIRQIYIELDSLQQEPVDAEELEMVRNYLMGNFLTMLDGAFNVSEIVKTQVLEGLPMNYFEELVTTVQNITAEELQQLAQRYLGRESMWEVVAGV